MIISAPTMTSRPLFVSQTIDTLDELILMSPSTIIRNIELIYPVAGIDITGMTGHIVEERGVVLFCETLPSVKTSSYMLYIPFTHEKILSDEFPKEKFLLSDVLELAKLYANMTDI